MIFGKNPVSDSAVKAKETGFFPNLCATTNDFPKNPVSDSAG
jgi:hypothetical protein